MKHMVAAAMLIGMGLVTSVARAELVVAPGVSARAGDQHIRTGVGVSLQAGGGVTNFTGSSARDVTNVGGYWDVRSVFGTRSFVGGEVAYVGSARGISTSSVFSNGTSLMGHGGEATLRLQVPMASSTGVLVEPFAFGGVGFSHYYLRNPSIGAVTTSDDVGTIPVGVGLAAGYRGFMVDARFTYRPTFNSDDTFFGTGAVNNGGLQSWTAGVSLGYEF
jgi:hypothetical protein